MLRKKLALLLCTVPMLLSACSAKRPAQPPLTFRTALLQSGGCSFTAAITADYGESAASFTLDCVFSPETGASVTVTEPESIAGIQAQVKDTAASVSYDGMQPSQSIFAEAISFAYSVTSAFSSCIRGMSLASKDFKESSMFLKATGPIFSTK